MDGRSGELFAVSRWVRSCCDRWRTRRSTRAVSGEGGCPESQDADESCNGRRIKQEEEKRQAIDIVSQDGRALRYVAEDLRSDREVVMKAVAQEGRSLGHAAEELRADREIVSTAVRNDWTALQFATELLRGDREIVLDAVSQNGWALQYVTGNLRGDREIVMEAVSKAGRGLEFAAEAMRGDSEIVMKAALKGVWNLQYASDELRSDRDFMRRLVPQQGQALRFATAQLRGDSEMMQCAFASPQGKTLLGLKVSLLSGRTCVDIFNSTSTTMDTVLKTCASLLELDDHQKTRKATLMHGTTEITKLGQLSAGEVHEVTLVLS